MGRGKVHVIQRGDSLLVDFYYKGERFRPVLHGLSAHKKAHCTTAEDILIQIQAEIAKGTFNFAKYFPTHPKAKRFRKGADITIKEKLNSWLETKRRSSERTTWILYKSAITYHLIPHFGDISLTDLTPNHVRDWMHSLSVSNKTINNTLTPLRAIFTEAYEDSLIDHNPLVRIRNLPRQSPEPKPFTLEELSKILAACDGQLHNLFKFAFWTGLRSSELIALQWKDVTLNKGIAHIRSVRTRAGQKDRPKTDSSIRNIELQQPAMDALRGQKPYTGQSDHVFHNPVTNKPWNHSERVKRFWTRILKRAGIEYRHPYTTRHTFASIMLSSGVNPMWVAKQMGHRDWGMIRKIYGRWIPDVDTSIQDKISHLWAPDRHKVSIND